LTKQEEVCSTLTVIRRESKSTKASSTESGSMGYSALGGDEESFAAFRETPGDEGGSRLLLTCEHARADLPPGYKRLGLPEKAFLEHFAWDPGAEELTRELSRVLGAPSVCSTFSRLFVDANRHPDDPTLVVQDLAGIAIPGNAEMTRAEFDRRRGFHERYHMAIRHRAEELAKRDGRFLLLSIHSYTPQLGGQCRRHLELGVLYDQAGEELGKRLRDALGEHGICCALNKPYSGWDGRKIYASARHGRALAMPYLTLEVRSDLLTAESSDRIRIRRGLVAALSSILSEFDGAC